MVTRLNNLRTIYKLIIDCIDYVNTETLNNRHRKVRKENKDSVYKRNTSVGN